MTCTCDDGVITFDPSSQALARFDMFSVFGTSLEVDGFDCWRDAFIGPFRGENNPIAVERGYCGNTNVNADHASAVLSSSINLDNGESKDFVYAIGVVENKDDAKPFIKNATNYETATKELNEIKNSWSKHLDFVHVNTPDELINTFFNVWHQYQCAMTFNWSRFISY
jgi:cellobiose phosphorylase